MANTICILAFRTAVNLANYDNADRGYYQKSTLESKHLETVAKIFKEFAEDMRRTHSSEEGLAPENTWMRNRKDDLLEKSGEGEQLTSRAPREGQTGHNNPGGSRE